MLESMEIYLGSIIFLEFLGIMFQIGTNLKLYVILSILTIMVD